jgi:HD-GYP domain-containing protein (c-di-GMP phosphodiesterase class II)
MLKLPIGQAEPGMRLAMPIIHPERGQLLLSEGYTLDGLVIRRLAEMQITEIWIDYPGSEQIKQYVSTTMLLQQSQLVATVADVFDRVHRDAHTPLEYERYRKTLHGLVEGLVSEPVSAAYIMELGGSASSDLRHGAEVALLSILLGLKLQGYLVDQRRRLLPKDARDVVSLGLGGMLHDIGKSMLDASVRDRYETTRDERDSRYRDHVVLGQRMLTGAVAASAVGVVLHHHQHFDGSGFPSAEALDGSHRGLAGEDIHVFARIACLANHFDRLRRTADGGVQPRVRVMRTLLATPMAARFDPVVLAMLPAVVPAYPPGSVVRLSDGTRGIVVGWDPESPCQPTIQALDESEAAIIESTPTGRTIDMRNESQLRVVEHDGEDVSGDNFRLLNPAKEPSKNAA